jgi:hypothetical protein
MSMTFTAKVKDGRLVVDPVVELREGPSSTMRSRRPIATGGFLPNK